MKSFVSFEQFTDAELTVDGVALQGHNAAIYGHHHSRFGLRRITRTRTEGVHMRHMVVPQRYLCLDPVCRHGRAPTESAKRVTAAAAIKGKEFLTTVVACYARASGMAKPGAGSRQHRRELHDVMVGVVCIPNLF